MADLDFKLLRWQQKVLNDKTRFKIVCAGRRCGKSRKAAVELIIKGLECPQGSAVMYVAPTQGQARVIIWDLLLDLGREVIKSSHVNNMEITLVNDIRIYVRGADRPDTLRGASLWYVVLDEYADMKPMVWEQIIRASLSDKKGEALFIGTPKGRNHFHDVYQMGLEDSPTYDPEYKSWSFTTADNELIDPKEIEAAKRTLSSFAFKQEYLASFDTMGTDIFKEQWLKYGKEPKVGSWYIACDLAGFEEVGKSAANSKKRLDQTAIAVVKVTDEGKWWVRKIEFGRWDIRETAVRILKNIREFKPLMVGIERGTTMNAVMPYLSDLMRKNNVFAHIHALSHNNQKKEDRVIWALQGMFEHGRVILNDDEDFGEFKDQLLMFPTKGVHDDLCLHGETLITMADGLQKPIKNVVVGDYVATLNGERKVVASKLTGLSDDIYILDDFGLIGTGSHPIYTSRGYVKISELTERDTIRHCITTRSYKCREYIKKPLRMLRGLILTGKYIVDTLIQSIRTCGDISAGVVAEVSTIGTYGLSIMEKSLLASTFTTKTETTSTTNYLTLNVSAASYTVTSTQRSIQKEQGRPSKLSILQEYAYLLLNGIDRKLDDYGIQRIARNHGKTRKNILLFVRNAGLRLSRFLLGVVFVEKTANIRIGVDEIQITSCPRFLNEETKVYNLTVDGEHCYFANGVLTHNCDALSYISQMAVTTYRGEEDEEEYEPMDIISGI